MNLYLVKRNDNIGYDQYISCVIAWDNDDIPPSSLPWPERIKNISVELIGVAVDGMERGVIHESFNAG